tara:strand:- start:555 stop:746 length:192 start_codon:yes stop_codon:yes gene_type:complete
MNDQVLIQCKHCRGFGERSMPFTIAWPVEYSGGDSLEEQIECPVCSGTGKVPLILDEILSEDQ